MQLRSLPLLLTLLGPCLGCSAELPAAEESGGGSGTGGDLSDVEVLQLALEYRSWRRVNRESRPSQHGLAETVNHWVPPELAETYLAIHPGDPASAQDLPTGAMLVKEHLDAMGVATGLTVMYRAAPGTAPDSADWWWGLIELPQESLVESGQVGWCISCHDNAASTGYVFGVALDNRL